jgi:hypothetical protein
MRQMTLRDIPDEIELIARSEASRQGISLNKAFLTLLRKSAQHTKIPKSTTSEKTRSSFSRFSGVWSDTDANDFDLSLEEQRTIDNEAWQ